MKRRLPYVFKLALFAAGFMVGFTALAVVLEVNGYSEAALGGILGAGFSGATAIIASIVGCISYDD